MTLFVLCFLFILENADARKRNDEADECPIQSTQWPNMTNMTNLREPYNHNGPHIDIDVQAIRNLLYQSMFSPLTLACICMIAPMILIDDA